LVLRKRYVTPFVACLALAAPAGAAAHARSPTVALDYRLVLDRSSRALPGVRVEILDGDRSLRVGAGSARVVVLGDLGEPMLRIDRSGAWANRASVTAVAQKLVSSGRGWRRVGGSTYAWHDHRLAPPPYSGERAGAVARFSVPVRIDGRAAAIGGSFVRYRRPAAWPWLVAAAAGIAVLVGLIRAVPSARAASTVAAGAVAGVAAVASLASFGAADSPTGRVAWVELGLAAFVGAAALAALVRSRGERRVVVAALIGAAAAATTLGSLGVFRHAVVISSFPPALARFVCALAFTCGVAAAANGLLTSVRRA
jgi:hypothetical protein